MAKIIHWIPDPVSYFESFNFIQDKYLSTSVRDKSVGDDEKMERFGGFRYAPPNLQINSRAKMMKGMTKILTCIYTPTNMALGKT